MLHSYVELLKVGCPYCGETVTAEIWFIVDAIERPDLLQRIQTGKMNELACPQCGKVFQVDESLVVFQPRSEPVLVFSPSPKAIQEHDISQATKLLLLLKERLGEGWKDEWLSSGLSILTRLELRRLLLSSMHHQRTPVLQAVLARMEKSASVNAIGETIRLCNEALSMLVCDDEPMLWAEMHAMLGRAYAHDFKFSGIESLDHAIDHCTKALEVYDRHMFPEEWALIHFTIGIAYRNRGRKKGQPEDSELAICHYHQALEIYTKDKYPQQWAQTQSNLANSYSDRTMGNKKENIEMAISCASSSLQIFDPNNIPSAWAQSHDVLGKLYTSRIEGDPVTNFETAKEHYEVALKAVDENSAPTLWADINNDLAAFYLERHQGNRTDNLELSIYHSKQALQVRTRQKFADDWAQVHRNLGKAYSLRIKGDQTENLEMAFFHCNEALKVYSKEEYPTDWASTHQFLGVAYCERIQGDRGENIEQAIVCLEKALEVFDRIKQPSEWAETQLRLGSALDARLAGSPFENWKQAVRCFNNALQFYTREDNPTGWASVCVNLGNCLCREEKWNSPENLEEGIKKLQEALEVFTQNSFPESWALTQNAIGRAFFIRTTEPRSKNITQAIYHFRRALEVATLERFPNHYLGIQRNLGDLHFLDKNWGEAHAAYAGAIGAGSLLLASAYTEAGRRGEIAATSLAYTRDAFCILCLGRLDEALLKLEQSKAHLLAEALAIGETELESLPAAQQEALKTVRQAVRMYEAEQRLPLDTPARRNDREIAEDLSTARARLWEIINNIRTQRPDFMPTGLNLQGLLKLIPEGGALVAPIVTSRGTAVFVLPHGVESVSAHHVILLERLTDSTLSNVLFGSAYSPQMGGWIVANMECRNNPERWFQIIEKTGGSLWEMLLEPVHKCLKDLKLSGGAPVLLLPQGGLGLLPLHASWCKVDGQRHYFLDDYTVTYAPSGFALDVSLQRLQEPQRRQRSLLVVANPTVDLMFASNECQHVAAFFREDTRRCLTEHEATLEEIVQVTPGKAYMHFSCHGFFNWKDPMQSGLLCAGNVPLTLSLVIGKLDLNACRLVVLSACETGLTDIRQSPDEYLGLPAGFLQAGAPAVVSTLWAVADLSTAILFRQFYHYHLKEKLEPATALSKAQRWLRDATAEDMGLAGYYEDVYRESGRSNSVALTWARYYSSNPDTRPFNHPFYWAGFIFSGA